MDGERFVPLSQGDPEGAEALRGLTQGIYLDGECYAFGIAVSEATGWPMVGLILDEVGSSGVIRHVGVRMPDERVLDARGPLTEREFASHFVSGGGGWRLRDVSASELLAVRPIHPRSIEHAKRFAETLWPSLPWKSTTATRALAFVAGLEAYCRERGFMIRGHGPAASPIVYECDKDDTFEYRLEATASAGQFLLKHSFD